MSGISIILDLLRNKPSLYTGQSLHSYGLISATAAASAAAASVAAAHPFASRAFFGYSLSLCVCVCVCGLRIQLGDNSFGWYYMDSSLGVDLFELSGYGQLCVLSR